MTFRFLKILLPVLLLINSANAQFVFFGRNKVQYQKFDWKILQTRHFNIYYYGDMYEIASIGAKYAEDAYREYKQKFGHIILHRIPLIFYNTHLHFQQTNTTPGFIPEGVGGFFEFMKGRVVIPSMGSLDKFRHVIRHELVHVFTTTKILRQLADHRLPADRLPPLWFIEGIAEHLSTDWDAQADMLLRDAVLNGYFTGITNIYTVNGSFLMYKQGQAFLEYIEEVYGSEKVFQMIDNFWVYDAFDDVIEYVLAKDIKDIDEEWLQYLRKKYFPLYRLYSSFGANAEPVTESGFSFSPVYYKDDTGETVYFIANLDGYSSLYKSTRLSEDEKFSEPKLVLRGETSVEIEAVHTLQHSLALSRKDILAFISKSGATDVIHFISVKSGQVIKTYRNENLLSITSPSFSPQGNDLVFRAIDIRGVSDLFVLDTDKLHLHRLTNDYYDDTDPIFYKDGTTIIFASDRTAGKNSTVYNLFSIDRSGESIQYITNLNNNCTSPFFNDDFSTLYFISEYDSLQNVYSIPFTPGNPANTINRVSNFIGSVFTPTIISGRNILFSGFQNFSFRIFITELDKDESFIVNQDTEFPASRWLAGKIEVPSEFGEVKYENEYTLDYAQSQISTDPVFGTRGGAVLSLSDLFGDDNYYFLISNTAQVQSDLLKSFNLALTRFYMGSRTNYGYGLFHFSGRRYDIRDSDEFYFERSFGGYFLLTYPLSSFTRFEADLSIANSDKQVITGVIERKALLWSNSIAYVHDNSLWTYTGPLDGTRFRLQLSYTSDVKYSNVNYYSIIADYRSYTRLSLRSTVAFRASFYYNDGKEARRYFMGGSWDIRGWPRWSIRGEKMWISSLEVRVPLIDRLILQTPVLDIGFAGIRAATFFDIGAAWDKIYRNTYGSVGFGFRMNFLNFLVLRYDMGKKIENNFRDFQPGMFYQFFFGWDF